MPSGYYLVRWSSLLGWTNHLVRKDRTCACPLGATCPAVLAVADYLRQGGQKAPDPRPGSLIPATCPICNGPVRFEPRLCSPMRGAGWVCLASASADTHLPRYWVPGERHYWAHMWAELGRLRRLLGGRQR
jgi:hypothetical protein